MGLARLAVKQDLIAEPGTLFPPSPSRSPRFPARPVFPWFAAGVWGLVLWLFEYHQEVLQASLQSSMTYLYHDSNVWTGIRDFIISNK